MDAGCSGPLCQKMSGFFMPTFLYCPVGIDCGKINDENFIYYSRKLDQ